MGHYHLHIFPRYENDGFGWKLCILGEDEDRIKILACMLKASANLHDVYKVKGISDEVYVEKAVGMTRCHVSNNVCRVDYLLVSKEHRNQGVGRVVIYHFVEHCKEHKIDKRCDSCSCWFIDSGGLCRIAVGNFVE